MKTLYLLFICLLTGTFPLCLSGQTLLIPEPTPLQALLFPNNTPLPSRQVTDDPLLRIRPDGPSGLDGVSIELNELSLSSPGPTIFLNCPPLSDPAGGRIFLQPDPLANGLIISTIGSSGDDGVSLGVGDPVIPQYSPRIQLHRPVAPGGQSGIVLSGVDEGPRIVVTNVSPQIVRLTADSDNPVELNKFHLDFDLPNRTMQWKETDLQFIRTFEPDIPRLKERVSSGDPLLVDSFFDIAYRLDDGSHSQRFGSEATGLTLLHVYDKAMPRLLTRVQSGDPIHVDSFFDITYRLDDGIYSQRFGSEATGLTLLHVYDKAIPRLLSRVQSGDPLYVDSFFDITYRLDDGIHSQRFGSEATGLTLLHVYDKAIPRLLTRVQSGDPMHIDSFFDITYRLDDGILSQRFGSEATGLTLLHVYDKAIPKLLQRIESNIPIYADSFFDITWDLSAGEHRQVHKSLQMVDVYDSNASGGGLIRTLSSTDPGNNDKWVSETRLDDATHAFSFNLMEVEFAAIETLPEVEFTWRLTNHEVTPLESVDFRVLPGSGLIQTYRKDVYLSETLDVLNDEGIYIRSVGSNMPDSPGNIKTEINPTQGEYTLSHQGLYVSERLDGTIPLLVETVRSDNPTIPDCKLEDAISLWNAPTSIERSLKFHDGLLLPLERLMVADLSTRVITTSFTDTELEVGLVLEHRLNPSGPVLALDGGLRVNNGSLASESGPLIISDELELKGPLYTPGALPLDLLVPLHAHGPVSNPDGLLVLQDDVQVMGNLNVSGIKNFRIDHPLDPYNKYLYHSCIESPDMMNVYNGNVITDGEGKAVIQLPDYFEALNRDFRYQLTCIGQFAQAIVENKISGNEFTIRTDKPNVEVSWQVTGIREDPAALQSGYQVVQEKEPGRKGTRLVDEIGYQPR